MTETRPTGPSGSPLVGRGDADLHAAVTRSLLGYGLVAGPLYVVSALVQGLVRDGFDLTRHDVSLLANGPGGWVQIATFVVCGLMTVAAGVGMNRSLRVLDGGRRTWGAWLVVGYGVGLVGAGAFVADPINGFPPGAPEGGVEAPSIGGLGHIAFAGLGFLCLIVACFVVPTSRPWFGRITGIVFLIGFAGVTTGSSSPVVVIGFWIAVILAWTWIAVTSLELYRRTPLLTPAG
ncbi:DUF998 domain-containing protein [Actinomycetospora termitidis]|uniref:DUF998 domain-containing protein n=1 Tax=Actinomycetospora termitidis TaxID=3053470 RepID=A0ABT7M4Y2_9PSEU|nr:DUF998 domain-containing protein [Actinomycetospora sp. Odt1-22]MDL5154483.1 DUF998 domain-containing protein [Actinomycetospora sp. Odt1-22]